MNSSRKKFSCNRAIAPVLLLTQLAAAAMLLAPSLAQAHGSLEIPLSRERNCKSEMQWNQKEGATMPTSDACIAAFKKSGTTQFYDWTNNSQSGQIDDQRTRIPNGLLCAGGKPDRAGLDVTGNWVSSLIAPDANGNVTLKYRQTAAHITNYFRTFITNDGYKFDRPIRWDDLLLVGDTGHMPRPAAGNNSMTDLKIKIPAGITGRRVLFNVWQRDPHDNAETFYACADVVVAGKPSDWQQIKALEFYDVPADSTATLRVFNARGQDVERHVVKISDRTSGSGVALAIGNKVNTASSLVRIGVMDNKGKINVLADAGKNQLFAREKTYTAMLEIKNTGDDIDPVLNRPPVSHVTGPQNVDAGEQSTLDASSSTDPDDDELHFSWKFPEGLTPTDGDSNALQQSVVNFIAPSLKTDTSFTFEVTVSDGQASSVAHHTVIVNKDPAAEGGGDVDPSTVPAYKPNTTYQPGAKVKNIGNVYQCKEFPASGWCGQAPAAYAPGVGYAWKDAWTKLSK
ncbi:MAG: hypothetical protein JWQ10_3153 [Herbaspirillum sp.]|nr:hypothetical protein [Herbaspirillum sp.]